VRIHVISDIHGEEVALARAAEGADALVCLGDLILFLDYDEPGRGIYAELFGEEHTRAYIEARTANRFEDARELSAAAWTRIGVLEPDQRWRVLQEKVREQYAQLFAALPEPATIIPGNVDVPALWPQFLRPGHDCPDGEIRMIGGLRWGFVGGGLVSPMRTPHERSADDYASALDALGPVDILVTHIPPALPLLTYDVVARRFEIGSAAIIDYILRVQPRLHLFGHVHQPLAARTRLGRTECVNVGHFHARRRAFAVEV
jgi:Icc-related predicted phosphoesterase